MQQPIDLGRIDPACTAHWHGTESAYRYGCRCPHARRATLRATKHRRAHVHTPRLCDITGTARRIRALNAIGWPMRELAKRLDCTRQAVQRLALEENPLVQLRTAGRVRALYWELSATPGPSVRARQQAAAKGWPTPIAWDDIDDPNEKPQRTSAEPAYVVDLRDDQVDEDAVEQAVRGAYRYGKLRPVDRIETYRRLRAAGMGHGAVQTRLSINGTTMRKLLELVAAAERTRVAA